MRFVIVSFFLLCGCGEPPASVDADEGGPTADAGAQAQTRRAVLRFGWEEGETIGVRLRDNGPVEGGGDVELYEGRVASLSSSSAQFCEKGVFDTLAEVPTDVGTCQSFQGEWTSRVYLSANTADAAFRGSDAGHAFLISTGTGEFYRALMVDVSHDSQPEPLTAQFDYEPLP